MTRLYRIDVADVSRRQIRKLNRWWRKNRTAARAFRLILNQPQIGPLALDVDLPDVRRIHLARIGHSLYSRVLESDGVIEVLAIWSDHRGEGPPI